MSKLNINKNEWLELVFEGKNKAYGAYQLRQEDNKTTAKAFFSAIALITGLALLPVLLSSFSTTAVAIEDKPDEVLRVTEVNFPKKEEVKKLEKILNKKAQPLKALKSEELVNIKVVDKNKAIDNITENKNVGKTTDPNVAVGGTGEGTPKGNTDLPVKNVEPDLIPDIVSITMVEKSPNFPGGIGEFLKTVGKRFVSPEMEEEKTIKVIVFFIVEKDGTISNITVPRNPGFGLDKEAIRVLKSIKTKWEPGIYKGQAVRTQFSLPIVVKTTISE